MVPYDKDQVYTANITDETLMVSAYHAHVVHDGSATLSGRMREILNSCGGSGSLKLE